jgi:hypothetical protein
LLIKLGLLAASFILDDQWIADPDSEFSKGDSEGSITFL